MENNIHSTRLYSDGRIVNEAEQLIGESGQIWGAYYMVSAPPKAQAMQP